MTNFQLNIPTENKQSIVSSSAVMQEINYVILQVAPTDITVLITGESGVGKELVSQAIHSNSSRSKKPMITVNCGAIPEGIIESELFGHEKGSFTGAAELRKGYFELADGGTIFLDEIGELPLNVQVKFLRILENGEFMRVGSSAPKRVNVRVIAATNKNLQSLVSNKLFRADLYYRLRTVNIHLPPLRDRIEDIPTLATKFSTDFANRNNITFSGFETGALEILKEYYWPGNVRELKNVIESMLVINRGKLISTNDVKIFLNNYQTQSNSDVERGLPMLPIKNELEERALIYRALVDLKNDISEVKKIIQGTNSSVNTNHVGEYPALPSHNGSLDEMERKLIIETLDNSQNNRRLAAEHLKISERTLYRKIKEYGLK